MNQKIEDYALIGDTHTAALVGMDGSIDWLCLPRFDSPACFARLVGTEDNGMWRIAPAEVTKTTRCYLDSTMVLKTRFESPDGVATISDFMPVSRDEAYHSVVRIVEVEQGQMSFEMDLRLRFEYGAIVPWVERMERGLTALAGANAVLFESEVPLRGEEMTTKSSFSLAEGERTTFCLNWFPSHLHPDDPEDPQTLLQTTIRWWEEWTSKYSKSREREDGQPYHEAIMRSLVTLKALTYAPTGALVAAPTTSLPECIGGSRNWDYRFCWLRDASFVSDAFTEIGYHEEMVNWHRWLLRVVAGHPSQVNVMYGLMGDRLLTEISLKWLGGYEDSPPVRIGNDASGQFQLDVFGEVLQSFYIATKNGIELEERAWHIVVALVEFLEEHWRDPDSGIWEVRGGTHQFTHSRVMAWVAADRAAKLARRRDDTEHESAWTRLAREIHEDVCKHGFDTEKNSFVQTYGSRHLDAALLLIPAVGFLEADDSRVVGTVAAIEEELVKDGFVCRYQPEHGIDGIGEPDGVFLPCSFWLVDCYTMMGRLDEAEKLFEQLISLRNDVGLISEEYDPHSQRMLGNFPQALTHVALLNSASRLARARNGERAD
ncbi:MAG: glycoside hydrolase family 15 protein [Dehalococcoidia bacterium]